MLLMHKWVIFLLINATASTAWSVTITSLAICAMANDGRPTPAPTSSIFFPFTHCGSIARNWVIAFEEGQIFAQKGKAVLASSLQRCS